MIYLSGAVCDLRHVSLGFMFTPQMGNAIPVDVPWAGDNGRFAAPEKYSDDGYLAWLGKRDPSRCLFATAPDVVGDHAATVKLSRPMFQRIRQLGYRVAFAAQDGWEPDTTSWDEFDVLFVGGTDAFKLGPAGVAIHEAKARGKPVHMGRCNSYLRVRVAAVMGCDTSDGTFLKFGPDINRPRLLKWFDRLSSEPRLQLAPVRRMEVA